MGDPEILGFAKSEPLAQKSLEHFDACILSKFEQMAKKEALVTIDSIVKIEENINSLL